MVSVRPFTGTLQDWEALVEVHNRFEPDNKTSVEQIKSRLAVFGDRYSCDIFIAERNGVACGSGLCVEAFWIAEENKKAINWACVPEESGTELEQALCDAVMEKAKSFDPDRIHARTKSIHRSQIRLLEALGFTCRQRLVCSEIDPQSCDPKPWADAATKLQFGGMRIETMECLSRRESNWKGRYLEMYNRLGKDAPNHTDFTDLDLEMLNHVLAEPSMDLGLMYVANLDGRWIGITELRRNVAMPERLNTAFTGVDREFRRQGVAIGLKGHALLQARNLGIQLVSTDNDENNPMLQLNLRLGFQPKQEMLLYVREERAAR